jgi:Domain of unknown function (DUF1917).
MDQLSDDKPSEVTNAYYVWAKRQKGAYLGQTERTGKWLIFVDASIVDEVWAKIKKATEDGILGDFSKVATEKPNPIAIDSRKKVICVYTYDWTDEKDVKRIREELRRIGITNKIPYKSDEDTLSGKYNATGYKRISKYYE